ncbi:uncharacterized protein C8Q71DRAFT_910044 [Rhodofomes roseus]|uniref:BTB domain-containing protein n=1 Tax=Rhodofomes roseus TaxID=34475 RepID=A0A4Y9Y2B8_9APHY|nr:uncharacterized protein C8Q71DRAFT_910044 [Rhodofomes roseus]KAH9832529.1 hypothetical protein C8Q71DRAFT_910044 [Rhodofomes roseus]TFY56232.1 hypothetical protein EVJ58_g7764 [Rhodofomes roseus]
MGLLHGLTPSRAIWYSDGNVILVAGNQAFRVHKGILSQYSPVFRDLFTIPQPQCELLIDGCAVVHLPDDPLHLEFLLSAMYDRSFFNGAGKSQQIAEVAAGILALAHKYNIESFYEEAVYRLAEDYPTTFDRFHSTEQYTLDPFEAAHHAGSIFLINVARRLRTPELLEMLPLAFYLCCLLDGDLLVHGVKRSNGEREKLSPDDLRRCIDGKEELMKANGAATTCLALSPGNLSEDCTTLDECKAVLLAIMLDAFESDILSACDALTNIGPWIEEKAKTLGMCDSCGDHLRNTHRDAQKVIWNDLRGIFNLHEHKHSSD